MYPETGANEVTKIGYLIHEEELQSSWSGSMLSLLMEDLNAMLF